MCLSFDTPPYIIKPFQGTPQNYHLPHSCTAIIFEKEWVR